MYILYLDSLRNIQIQMGKVPDSFNSRIDQPVSQLRSFCFRNGQCCHLNIIIFDKLLQIIHSCGERMNAQVKQHRDAVK